jgi:hypothetical protein
MQRAEATRRRLTAMLTRVAAETKASGFSEGCGSSDSKDQKHACESAVTRVAAKSNAAIFWCRSLTAGDRKGRKVMPVCLNEISLATGGVRDLTQSRPATPDPLGAEGKTQANHDAGLYKWDGPGWKQESAERLAKWRTPYNFGLFATLVHVISGPRSYRKWLFPNSS